MKFHRIFWCLAICYIAVGCSDNSAPTDEPTVKEKTYPIGYVNTRLGEMYFWLYDETPNHKAKFIELANAKHYDQFTFNRVVNNFVIQGGCPDSPSYFTDSPYLLDPEFVDSIGHRYGALGMGRDDNPEKRSNGCQFYIVSKEAGLPNLDGEYMIFGKIIAGENVLEAIESEPVDNTNTPTTPIPLEVGIQQFTKKELLDSLGFNVP